jgi:hypothetical protein
MQSTQSKMRRGTYLKYKSIQDRFNILYNTKRLRYDDCIEKIMQEYYIEHRETVSRIMRVELVEPIKCDPNQLTIFDDGVPAM